MAEKVISNIQVLMRGINHNDAYRIVKEACQAFFDYRGYTVCDDESVADGLMIIVTEEGIDWLSLYMHRLNYRISLSRDEPIFISLLSRNLPYPIVRMYRDTHERGRMEIELFQNGNSIDTLKHWTEKEETRSGGIDYHVTVNYRPVFKGKSEKWASVLKSDADVKGLQVILDPSLENEDDLGNRLADAFLDNDEPMDADTREQWKQSLVKASPAPDAAKKYGDIARLLSMHHQLAHMNAEDFNNLPSLARHDDQSGVTLSRLYFKIRTS